MTSRPPQHAAEDALLRLRQLLATQALRLVDHLRRHRDGRCGAAREAQELLDHWPDVVAATLPASGGGSATLHFAPATTLSLLEPLTLCCVALWPQAAAPVLLRSADGSEADAAPALTLLPLSAPLVERLRASTLRQSGAAAERWAALQLLPDHCRLRSLSAPAAAPATRRLTHWYALLSDEHCPFAAQGDDAAAPGDSAKRPGAACVYLAQLLRVEPGDCDAAAAVLRLQPDATLRPLDDAKGRGRRSRAASEQAADGDADGDRFAGDAALFRDCVVEEQRRLCRGPLLVRPRGDTAPPPSATNPLVAAAASDAAGDGAAAGRQWDATLLSPLCLWRACLSPACAPPAATASALSQTQAQLCRYHHELRASLDAQLSAGGASESAKFLPKKPPALQPPPAAAQDAQQWQSKRDLQLLRAASSLLQELWDGRLKSTVRLFAKKVAGDMRLRSVCEAALQQLLRAAASRTMALPLRSLPPPPPWALWRDAAQRTATLESQQAALQLLQVIARVERDVSAELAAFGGVDGLRVFPAAEIAQMRRDVRAFKELQEQVLRDPGAQAAQQSDQAQLLAVLGEEARLSERKLQLLRARRLNEEEARAVLLRRAQRQRQLEEAQARDPANFNFAQPASSARR